ncbi:guanine nucleotide-binding protein G(f) subunit alpha [Euwallacea similis]|uniref:guanine nucleotide-binding protein G(f) subunit alpha n=1 Tax=Euwallacea similis TaxID=1736056 RepID=UPI00345021D4
MALCCRRRELTPDEDRARKYTEVFVDTKKILLLGTGESGKTTIIKQMRILHINGFSDEDRRKRIPNIKQNIHESIYDILYNMDKINPPTQVKLEETRNSVEYILNLGTKEPKEYTEEYFDHVKTAWADEGVKETFQRSNEFQLIDSAEHFLNKIDEIKQSDYIPDSKDILFCRVETKSISKIEFEVPLSKLEGGKAHFWMYDVGGQRGHRKRWIQVFDGIQAILFLISASDFDQNLREDPTKNRLQEAFDLLNDIHRSKFVREAGLIVFLNKQDLLKKKILEQHRKMESYFPEYANYVPDKKEEWDGKDEYVKAKLFMRHKVLTITSAPVKIENIGFVPGYNIDEELPPRDVHVHFTVATDTNNIRKVFESVRQIILKNITGTLF